MLLKLESCAIRYTVHSHTRPNERDLTFLLCTFVVGSGTQRYDPVPGRPLPLGPKGLPMAGDLSDVKNGPAWQRWAENRPQDIAS